MSRSEDAFRSQMWANSTRNQSEIPNDPQPVPKLLPIVSLLALSGRVIAGPHIACVSLRDGYPLKLYVLNADGSEIHRIGTMPGDYEDPQFSPDGKKICFTYDELLAPDSVTLSQTPRVFIINSDGTNEKPLSNGPVPDTGLGPRFTASGKIVFTHADYAHSRSTLFIVDPDAPNPTPKIFEVPGLNNLYPYAFGPNGAILFEQSPGPGIPLQLFKVESDGTGLIQLTNTNKSISAAAWSPNGSLIAYANTGDSEPDAFQGQHQDDGIYVMNADGGHPARIVRIDFGQDLGPDYTPGSMKTPQLFSSLSFSPDSRMLTYSLRLKSGAQIYVVNVDGTGLRQLTEPPIGYLSATFGK
jgi:Tol biopolymer transport system component